MATTQHANQSGAELHEALRHKQPVRAASTANVTLATPGSTLDGVTLSSGDRVLLKNQTAPAENGIYVWTGAAAALTRVADADAAADFVYLFFVGVREGTTLGSTYWVFSQSAVVTLGTTAITFAQIATSALLDVTTTRGDLIARGASAIVRLALGATGTFLSSDGTDPAWGNSAKKYTATGDTGATAASAYVGATASGAPLTGTHAVGDFVVDQTGKFWVCTGAGTPGTWAQASGGMANPMTTNQDLVVGATAGAPTRLGIGANGQVLSIVAGAVAWANSAAGFSNVMTAIGDMIIGTTAGAAARLAIGGNDQILTVVGGVPVWANNTGGTSLGANAVAATNTYLARNFM